MSGSNCQAHQSEIVVKAMIRASEELINQVQEKASSNKDVRLYLHKALRGLNRP
jgi:hypothetical protein